MSGSVAGAAPVQAPAAGAAAAVTAMSARTHDGLWTLGAAVVAGVAGDWLARGVPWGAGLPVGMLLMCVLVLGLARVARGTVAGTEWVPWVVAMSLLMAWRDAGVLWALDLLAIGVVVALAVFRAQGGAVRVAGVGDYVLAMLRAGVETGFGALLLLGSDVRWREVPRDGWTRHAVAVARGLAIAAPLLVVFGALLAAADAVFQGLLSRVFAFSPDEVVGHVVLAGILGWAAAGVLRALFLAEGKGALRVGKPAWGVGTIEVVTVLGLVNLLFAAFVAVQVRYLFGGAEVVTLPGSEVSYAEYARRGFFELVTVAGMVLPVLLVGHWLIRAGDARAERVFRALAGATVVLLGVIMASAMKRMWMYQAAYGLTELRFLTTAFMGWLAVVFAWFAATSLRGRPERFAFGAVVAGGLAIGALHVANPGALVVRVNAARAAADPRFDFDAEYAVRLGADAVPALMAAYPRLDAEDRCVVAVRLLSDHSPAPSGDWRSWTWAQGQGFAAVTARERTLRAACPQAAGARRGVYVDLSPAPPVPVRGGT